MPSQVPAVITNGKASKSEADTFSVTDINFEAAEAFFKSVREISETYSYKVFQALVACIKSLRQQVDAKNEENDRLENEIRKTKIEHDAELCKSAERYTASIEKEKERKTDLERNLADIEEELLKEREARQREENEKQEATTHIQRLAAAFDRSRAEWEVETSELSANLKIAKQELGVWESYAEHLHSGNSQMYTTNFEKLWKSARKSVVRCFKEDLPDLTLKDPKRWEEFMKLTKLSPNVPIPHSNSIPAKHMRTAAVLAVLAHSLYRYIFTPAYIIKEDSELHEVPVYKDDADIKKERLCRGLLLSMFESEQKEYAEERIDKVMIDVRSAVQALVTSEAADSFEGALLPVVQDALEVWWNIQRNKERFESVVRLGLLEDWEWRKGSFGEETSGNSQDVSVEDLSSKVDVLVVFPGLYSVKKDDYYEPVFSGITLTESQTKLAAKEMENAKTSNGALERSASTKTTSQRLRRASASVSAFLTPRGS